MIKEFECKAKERSCRDEEADAYDFQFNFLRNVREIAHVLRNIRINRSDVVLDVGSGTGRFTAEFTKRGAEVVALDYSARSLKMSKSRCKCHVVLADLCYLPFRNFVFDKAAGISVFQHVPTMRSRIAGLHEIRRVSKKKASFVIMVYHNRLWEKIKGFDKQGFHRGLIYYYRFDVPELKQLLLSVFPRITCMYHMISEETFLLRPALRLLCGVRLSKIAFFSLDLIEKMPMFRSFLCDHILSVCES